MYNQYKKKEETNDKVERGGKLWKIEKCEGTIAVEEAIAMKMYSMITTGRSTLSGSIKEVRAIHNVYNIHL